MAGARHVHPRIAGQIGCLGPDCLVLDLGGGTGSARSLWADTCTYMCLDIDIHKLQGFKLKYPDGIALLSDATRIPIRTGTVDALPCVNLTHHLSDDTLIRLINEGKRVLKDAGRFILVDAFSKPGWLERLLWKYDRGGHPRTARALFRILSPRYEIIHWECFILIRGYVLCTGTIPSLKRNSKKSPPRSADRGHT
jgi:SAM-dependent methyltransferase